MILLGSYWLSSPQIHPLRSTDWQLSTKTFFCWKLVLQNISSAMLHLPYLYIQEKISEKIWEEKHKLIITINVLFSGFNFQQKVFFDTLRPPSPWFLFLFTRWNVMAWFSLLTMALQCNQCQCNTWNFTATHFYEWQALHCILGDRTAWFTFLSWRSPVRCNA